MEIKNKTKIGVTVIGVMILILTVVLLTMGTDPCYTQENELAKWSEASKQVSTKIHMHNTDVTVIGSLWELGFSHDVAEPVQVFALDCGLGERNSLGFGFLNELSIV